MHKAIIIIFVKDLKTSKVLSLLQRLSDNKEPNSLANRLRRKRFKLFLQLLEGLEKPVKVLDLGGTVMFWEQMGFGGKEYTATDDDPKPPESEKPWEILTDKMQIKIYLLNKKKEVVKHSDFISLAGDARNLQQFEDNSFDIAFSNSVIEHVGGWEDQRMMADEMLRVGKRLYLQTPNRYFLVEPHFLFPMFQFFPIGWRIFLVRNFNLGWYKRLPDRQQAEKKCRSIRLLTKTELKKLFPSASIHTERFFGLAKSFVVTYCPKSV